MSSTVPTDASTFVICGGAEAFGCRNSSAREEPPLMCAPESVPFVTNQFVPSLAMRRARKALSPLMTAASFLIVVTKGTAPTARTDDRLAESDAVTEICSPAFAVTVAVNDPVDVGAVV